MGYRRCRSLLLRRLRPEVLRLLWTRIRLRPSWRLLRWIPSYYGKREAEAEPEAEATAAADPYYYGGYGLRSYGYGLRSYGLGYGRGYYGGYRGYYGKREAEAEPEAEATAAADPYYYGGYGLR